MTKCTSQLKITEENVQQAVLDTFNNVPELDSILAVCATELNNNGENQSALNDSTTAEE